MYTACLLQKFRLRHKVYFRDNTGLTCGKSFKLSLILSKLERKMSKFGLKSLSNLLTRTGSLTKLPQVRQLSSVTGALGSHCKKLTACQVKPASLVSVRYNQFQGTYLAQKASSRISSVICNEKEKKTFRNISNIRQNFHEECESAINKQIGLELYAGYTYRSIAWYFDRHDVALKGFHNFFKGMSAEESAHADKFMTYMNKRGGSILLENISKPEMNEWESGLKAMEKALALEKKLNEALLHLHTLAEKHGDSHLCDFLEEEYLKEQVEAIKELCDYVTLLQHVGSGLGEYLFDKETLQDGNAAKPAN